MRKRSSCGSSGEGGRGHVCCRVEALVGVDERGQMVLPKKVREKAGIKAGDKLAVVSWKAGGKISCLCLVKADEFGKMAREIIGPAMKSKVR